LKLQCLNLSSFARAFGPERWRLAGWIGGVLAAEWEACAGVGSPANVEGLAIRRRDAAGPAGEDASVPSREVKILAGEPVGTVFTTGFAADVSAL
jgi:hypothetical protein